MPRHRVTLGRVLIGAVTLVAAAITILPTAALTLGQSRTDTALRFWPMGAATQASKAATLLASDLKAPTLERADRLSRAALRREPINVTAARVQAIVAAARGQERAAVAWLNYAERLSRRDFPVQTMLIEVAVAREDIPGALVHYDRALRTKREAGNVLFPVLFGAATDPAILSPLARLLAQRPEWWYDFAVRWQTTQPPVLPLFNILMAVHPDISVPRERVLVVNSMRQMMTAGRADLAARLHDKVKPAGAAPAGTFVDGDFAMKNDLLPFGWDLVNEIGLAGVVERRGEPLRTALTLDIGSGLGGAVAKQLVRLAPGRYRLTYRVGDVLPDGVVPSVAIGCAAGAEGGLADQRIDPGEPSVRGLTFQVNRGCTAQNIEIRGRSGNNDSLPRPWISNMVLRRLD